MILPTPRRVLRYAAAATAGYSLTSETISWLMSLARWMSSVAMMCTILACASLYSWLTEPSGRNYLLIYFAICCVVALVMVAPMIIVTHIALRLATKEEEE